MALHAYLSFPGTARAAMEHYARLFGAADLSIMTYADAPDSDRPPGVATDAVMHADFSIAPGVMLMGADAMPGMPAGMGGAAVFHAAPDAGRARALFDALAEGGEVLMPFGPTFWSAGFGCVADRWGTNWYVSVADPAMAGTAAAAGA